MSYIAVIITYVYLLFLVATLVILAQLLIRTIIGTITKKDAPFVPIPDKALPLLNKVIIPKEKGIMYDLGCGDGKVLLYLATKFPEATYIGIEYGILPYILAKINTRKYKNITILFKNFFKEELTKADVLIVYLFPQLMDALLPKLEKELKPGAMVYSFDFPFSKKEPSLVEENSNHSASRGKRMFIYKF